MTAGPDTLTPNWSEPRSERALQPPPLKKMAAWKESKAEAGAQTRASEQQTKPGGTRIPTQGEVFHNVTVALAPLKDVKIGIQIQIPQTGHIQSTTPKTELNTDVTYCT